MSSSRKPLSQIAAELGLPADASDALVSAIAEQVRAQLQAEHQAALAQREAEVAAQVRAEVTAAVTAQLKAEHLREMVKLYEQLRLQRRRLFGSSSEAHAGQYHLFNEAELAQAEQPDAPETAGLPATDTDTGKDIQPAKPLKARGMRKPIPSDLPRATVVNELPEAERLCPCGTPMVEIGRDVSEQLDIIPMQVRVLRHERAPAVRIVGTSTGVRV